jgi:hypothetical protein
MRNRDSIPGRNRKILLFFAALIPDEASYLTGIGGSFPGDKL